MARATGPSSSGASRAGSAVDRGQPAGASRGAFEPFRHSRGAHQPGIEPRVAEAAEFGMDALGQAGQHLAGAAFDQRSDSLRLHVLNALAPAHETGHLLHQPLLDVGGVRDFRSEHVGDQRHAGRRERHLLQRLLHGVGGRLHQRAMEGRADRQQHAALYRRPGADLIEPALDVRVVGGKVDRVPLVARHPGISGDVGDGVFAAQERLLFQMGIEHAVQTPRLLAVALDAVGHLDLGGAQEVVRLAEHRAHAAHLEHQPLQHFVLAAHVFGDELARLAGEVQQDRA